MLTQDHALILHDCEPDLGNMYNEVCSGLSDTPKTLPCKYFYDEVGSQLFDAICELDEYYPTRTETGIMLDNVLEISQVFGERCQLIEYGSGSSIKTTILLDHSKYLASYVPVDISRQHLMKSAQRIADRYPELEVLPVCADYTTPFTLPRSRRPSLHAVVYFPGSTIGNFHPDAAVNFLSAMAETCGKGGGLLIGVDLKKPSDVLERAYDDSRGITAAFNLNILTRINKELGGNFNCDAFVHHARYNKQAGRVEMHLVSKTDQRVTIGNRWFEFASGESIHTECSYKYTVEEFAALAELAGWSLRRTWTDAANLFSIQYLTAL